MKITITFDDYMALWVKMYELIKRISDETTVCVHGSIEHEAHKIIMELKKIEEIANR